MLLVINVKSLIVNYKQSHSTKILCYHNQYSFILLKLVNGLWLKDLPQELRHIDQFYFDKTQSLFTGLNRFILFLSNFLIKTII